MVTEVKKISALDELLTLAAGDLILAVDISEALEIDKNKRVKYSTLKSAILNAMDPGVELFPRLTALAPLSGIDVAPYSLGESSGAGTVKPLFPKISFENTADQGRMFVFKMPDSYSSGLTIEGLYSMGSANTSKAAVLNVQIAAISDGDASVDAKVFDTANQITESVPNTAGEQDAFSASLTNVDSVAAGDWVCLVIWRDYNHASDTAAGDFNLRYLGLTYNA